MDIYFKLMKMDIYFKLLKMDIYLFSQNITAVLQYSDLTYFLCFFNGSCNSPVELWRVFSLHSQWDLTWKSLFHEMLVVIGFCMLNFSFCGMLNLKFSRQITFWRLCRCKFLFGKFNSKFNSKFNRNFTVQWTRLMIS